MTERRGPAAYHVGGERDGKRIRPTSGGLTKASRTQDWRAELVCSASARPDRPPMLLALIGPRDMPAARLLVLIAGDGGLQPLGADFVIDCRCGEMHSVDGGKLRSEVLGSKLRPRRYPPPRIDVTACPGKAIGDLV